MWNKIAAIMLLVTASSLLITPIGLYARGGRGGGGGGPRGGGSRGAAPYRGGNTMNRTPTMSRAQNTQVRSQPRQPLKTRPNVKQNRSLQPRQSVRQKPTANRSDLRNQVNRYAQTKSVQNVDRQALNRNAQNFSNKRSHQLDDNRQLANRTSQRIQRAHPNSNQWFNRDFFDRYNTGRDYVGTGANWWRAAGWATLASWGDWNWSSPYYYDGSYAYPLSYSDYSSYTDPYNTTTIMTSDTSQNQSTQNQTNSNSQTLSSNGGDWLPLGVFAIANNPNAAASTNRFIQLALNRNGEIAGVLYNSATDSAQDLTGMINTNNQQAHWSLTDKSDSPIASTGIYNLTEDQTSINVHFSDGSDQTWTLVRLEPLIAP